jgi:hypothetical protein
VALTDVARTHFRKASKRVAILKATVRWMPTAVIFKLLDELNLCITHTLDLSIL